MEAPPWFRFYAGILFVLGVLCSAQVYADVAVDIRAAAPLAAQTGSASYVASIADCTSLASIDVVAGATQQTLSPAQSTRIAGSATGCEFSFQGAGAGLFDPQITLHFQDGSSQVQIEHYQVESNAPSLTFKGVSLSSVDGAQFLNVEVNASDDVDLDYVGFSVIGLKASDLHAAGGVVSVAEQSAFANTDGTVKVYPQRDKQGTYSLAVPVSSELSADEIAHDGVVLLDLVAVDASGNQSTVSTLAFTGSDVVEQASSLQASPQKLIFNNLLETAAIVPTVDFQFRGPTNLTGAGSGVTYQSSQPDVVAVTSAGVVYPLKATNGQDVTITVSYPGLTPVQIPVSVDPTKQLVNLQVDGLNANGQFVLDHLNGAVALPKVYALFDDGSRTEVGSQFALDFSAGSGSTGILDVDQKGNLIAHAIIPADAPIPVTVRLHDQPDIKVDIPVVSQDGLPAATIQAPSAVQTGDTLTVTAQATDDVAVKEVRFYMDGAPVGTSQRAPYQISVQTTSDLANQTLKFTAVAIDSAGQASQAAEQDVTVQPKVDKTVPALAWEGPTNLQRVVTGSPVQFTLSRKIDFQNYNAEISYVDFFVDGTKIGTANFPRIEKRQEVDSSGKKVDVYYELWQYQTTAPQTSVDETSVAFYAMEHGANGGSLQTSSQLLRVIKNSPPSIQIVSPTSGSSISVGQTLTVNVQFSDDTLPVGAEVELLLDDKSVAQFQYADSSNRYADQFTAQSATHSFTLPVTEDELGSTLRLQAKIVDADQMESLSTVVKIPVHQDQPPTVAISYPTNGVHIVAGQPIEIRATAEDDVAVKRVDFYVNGRMVGSDNTAPYAYSYDTTPGISQEQAMTVYAVAVDSKDQESTSASVQVTLGKDEESPVVNIVSPAVTSTEAGTEMAQVIEDSTTVFKVTGYDNVGVTGIEVHGIKKVGTDYVLTGNMTDVLSGSDVAPQQVPGALHAFSSLKLIKIPLFSHAANVTYDQYPVEVIASDATGNTSTSKLTVAVVGDQDPSVVNAQQDHDSYFPKSTVTLDVQTRDDRAVSAIKVSYYLDDSTTPIYQDTHDSTNGIVPGAEVQSSFVLDLSTLNLSNANHTIRAQIVAIDDRGHSSVDHGSPYELQIPVHPDTQAPLLGVLEPIQGSTLYAGHTITVKWHATDDSELKSVRVLANGAAIQSTPVSGQDITTQFTYQVPSGASSLTLEAHATDIYGNDGVTSWKYTVTKDLPPTVSIRAPAQGSRLVEGEPFTMSAYVADDGKVSSVTFFIQNNGADIFSKTIDSGTIAAAIAAGQPVSAAMRVPHRPDAGEGTVTIGVRATDDAGQTSQVLLVMDILDDEEAPKIQLTTPDKAFSVMPGASFDIKGSGNDNIYIDKLIPVIIDSDGTETVLPWQVLSRNDHIESITVPNPDSFGSVTAAQRFDVDFTGRVLLPASMISEAGKTYKFELKAQDMGVNTSATQALELTIQKDTSGPDIQIQDLPDTVYDRQPLSPKVTLSDNVAVASYKIYLSDDAQDPLADESGLSEATITTDPLPIDLSRYDPLPADGSVMTMVVEATDTAGNESRVTKAVKVMPDQPPQLSVADSYPGTTSLQGGLTFNVIHMNDDYVSGAAPVEYFAAYTSLSGLDTGGIRSLIGKSALDNKVDVPYISLNYPESNSQSVSLNIGGKPYMGTADNVLSIWPLPKSNGRLKLDAGTGNTVQYEVKTYSNASCTALVNDTVVTDSAGVDLSSLLQNDVTVAQITPKVLDANGGVVGAFIHSIRIDSVDLQNSSAYSVNTHLRQVDNNYQISVIVADQGNSASGTAVIAAPSMVGSATASHDQGQLFHVPVGFGFDKISVLGHATDRFSIDRGPLSITPLTTYAINSDQEPPQMTVTSPDSGITVVPAQRILINIHATDNAGLRSLQLVDASGNIVREIGASYGSSDYVIPYHVPLTQTSSLALTVIAVDQSGATTTQTLSFPVAPNLPPQLTLKKFSTYMLNGHYQKVLDTPDRVNYGEFWVRVGEPFRLDVQLDDDAGLASYTINRIDRSGNRIQEFTEDLDTPCPKPSTLTAKIGADIVFKQTETTEYEAVVVDTYGNKTVRSFVVHPLGNMAPEIRITSPADEQDIVAGTFQIKVGVVATDDRALGDSAIALYANGVRLTSVGGPATPGNDQDIGGSGAVQQAFASMYDDIEKNYSVDMADSYGFSNSPYAIEQEYHMSIPAGLVRFNEPVKLTAVITDSDGAVSRHEITLNVAPDTINPEVAITKPAIDYGPTEASDFTLGFEGYDNVKVAELQVYEAYGVMLPDNQYVMTNYGNPVRTVDSIDDKDFNPITTVNIDTPEYLQTIHVDRLQDIINQFPQLSLSGNEKYDVWIKLVARDAAGNVREREVRYPVRIDERPVVDILTPTTGAKVVEGTPLTVNVKAFDDVGIDSLRLTAMHGTSTAQIYNILLRQPPYGFQLKVPAFDASNSANNLVTLHVEAIDTYGAAFGDLDKHRAQEDETLQIVQDQPPSVAIGAPKDGATVTEGEHLLVQVNAADDVGIDRVVLQVAGLAGGDRVFTDTSYPFEFLVDVPYGQAGQDLTLSASAVEKRYSGTARVATTLTPVHVHVERDTTAPDLTVSQPAATGATVVEKRALSFVADAHDNVAVSTVKVEVAVDINGDGQFTPDEVIAQRTLLNPPYAGSISIGTLSDYLGDKAAGVDHLPLQLTITAQDGAGNQSVVTRPVMLVRNQPPSIDGIEILDDQGYSLGTNVSQITEGRNIVVQVAAHDPEAGVQSARLYQAVNPSEAASYTKVGEDNAAPFQFHIKVPEGSAGSVLSFEADATDVDGYQSALSAVHNISIVADQPPTAGIVKPDNSQAVVIDGQDVEVWVKADDDLGPDGIDRVVFSVNGTPVQTVYDSLSKQTGSANQDDIYRAIITPPPGTTGFVVQATAYDVAGHSTQTAPLRIGKVADTVAPKISIMQPFDGDVLTEGENIHAVVAVDDIGSDAVRHVYLHWVREYQDAAGNWKQLASADREINRDDTRASGDMTPVSDPDNNHYIYWGNFVDSNVIKREQYRNERVRLVAEVRTPNHDVTVQSTYEVGLPVSERRFLLPAAPASTGLSDSDRSRAQSVYYTAVSQFQSSDQTGAMLGSWSTVDPMRLEQGLGNVLLNAQSSDHPVQPLTGLFIADDTNDAYQNGDEHYVYSDLLAGASELFAGTISEIHSDANFVMASKSGLLPGMTQQGRSVDAFAGALINEIKKNPDSGGIHLSDSGGELLIFTVHNGDNQFGLPYLLKGRVDLPYPDVYGLDRKDNLAFVANGNGGVQVIDISNLAAPYHVGYIKPDGFARDVKIKGNFAYIVASHQGLVVADISNPSMPIVASLDTLGIANRLQIVGNKVYVTDMVEDGTGSELNIISIADPYHPKLLHTVELNPARKDLVPGGAYDVTVAGNKAFVTVMYKDQENQPSQSLVQVINLAALDDPTVDNTVPVMIHRNATSDDFAARGLIIARGALQVAAGKHGIDRIDLPELTVLSQQPAQDATNVSTELGAIDIELSSVLSPDTDLSKYVQILEGDPTIGKDVTADFQLGFAQRNGAPAYRFLHLVRKDGVALSQDTRYYVVLRKGLAPLTGLPMAQDYQSSFVTSAVGAAAGPTINSVSPDTGSIQGGTPLIVRGTNFGSSPSLYLGGQRLVIDKIEPATSDDPYQKIYARTVPNYAGPAAVRVVNANGLDANAIGLFTYVDILSISYVDPPIVRVSQAGQGDIVDVVGYGFDSSVTLKAYPSGHPELAVTDTVDQDRLKLYSAERMTWVVPDFGGSYRGYVDVEISDTDGRKYLLPDALFYGHLTVDRELEAEQPLKPPFDNYVPDALKLPPGRIVDLASDPQLGLIYVLGRGTRDPDVTSPQSVNSVAQFHADYAPGWISLVHYQRDALGNAAPMYGFGYYNLPQELVPTAMQLTDKQLYVAAQGYHFSFIDTPYEDQRVILVYDREDHLPGTGDPAGKNRDILYSLPLNFKSIPASMAHTGDLLFAASAADGVAVISVADPKKPSVIRVLTQGNADGETINLTQYNSLRVQAIDGYLHVITPGGRFVFDVSRPSMPQVGYFPSGNVSAAMVDRPQLVAPAKGTDLALYDASRPNHLQELGSYDDLGFRLQGNITSMAALDTLAGVTKIDGCSEPPGYKGYLSLYDTSRPQQIGLLDATKLFDCEPGGAIGRTLLTRDGIVVLDHENNTVSQLMMVDTLTPDLVTSFPADGAVGVPTNATLQLKFSVPIAIPSGSTALSYLSKYLALLYDDGSQQGVAAAFTPSIDPNDPTRVLITPTDGLVANGHYRLVLKGELGSLRTVGLFDRTIRFTAAADSAPLPQLGAVAPTVLVTGGGALAVDVTNADNPTFLVAGQAASVTSSETVNATTTRYHIEAPSNLAGPAQLTVVNANGGEDSRIGAVQYVEPLHLDGATPAQGSVNGGTTVTITGSGFRPGLSRVSVTFGGIPADDSTVKVLDAHTLSVVTPAGRIGAADITVSLDNGESATLPGAFNYQQPIQSNIEAKGRIYAAVLDPTQNYLVAAAGTGGVRIYNVNASTYTGDPNHPLNADDLRHLIDRNNDGIDDRLLARVPLPGGYAALCVATYFEHGEDRVFVTAARLGGGGKPVAGSAQLFIVAFDSDNVATATVVSDLPLPADFARGIRVQNNQALVAMGNGGVGLVDAYLHTKTYLAAQLTLPQGHEALDVARLPAQPGQPSRYAAVAGHFDFGSNTLLDAGDPSSGGFYLLQQSPTTGFTVVGSLAVPASRVVIVGHYAYLAAGERGLVIVDISDPTQPKIVSRVTGIGTVHDLDVNGNTVYLALGSAGIRTVDVTDPLHPQLTAGMESFHSDIDVVVAGSYGAYGTGVASDGNSVVQVTPDVILKIQGIDPADGILDQDALGHLTIDLRFNKAIDLAPDNLHRFTVLGPDGGALPVTVQIVNNDAILTVTDASSLKVGDHLTVVANAGIASVKPLSDGRQVVLYTLAKQQRFMLTYRGVRPDTISVDSVVPRRMPLGKPSLITISGQGIPQDISLLKAYVGGVAATVQGVTASTQTTGASIVTVQVPALNAPGLFDVTLQVNQSGVWQSATLYGGLMVDAPIRFDTMSPRWGPLTGGTVAIITGQGFEPGNTVMDGLKIRIGSVPVASIRVFSTTRLQIVTREGTPGRHDVSGEDRYGGTTVLSGDKGFGYGIKFLGSQQANNVFPSDVWVDPDTGVAITNAGYVTTGYMLRSVNGVPFPETLRAASFDIQNPTQPLLVGGVSSLPSGPEGQTLLSDKVTIGILEGKQILGSLSAAEQQQLAALKGADTLLAMPVDSIRIQAVQEPENGVVHKRLYVANGSGGVARINLDDENGMQLLSQVPDESADDQVTDVLKWGSTVYAVHASDLPPPVNPPQNSCDHLSGKMGGTNYVDRLSYADVNDPVDMGPLPSVEGGNAIARDNEWIYAGGIRSGSEWLTTLKCVEFRSMTADRPGDAASGTITATNLFDPELTRTYTVPGNVIDIASYGHYLIAALGSGGVEILDKDAPEKRVNIPLDRTLMDHVGRAARLKRFGNLLFVSAEGGGLVVLDLTKPLAPRVISAGNVELIQAADVFKGRVVTGAAGSGVSEFELPGSFATTASVDEGGLIADGESLTLTFNEPMTVASLQASGAVSVTRADTGAQVPVTVTPVIPASASDDSSSDKYTLDFARVPGVGYTVKVQSASNLRSSDLWAPFVLHLQAAPAGAQRPQITSVDGGVFHRGDNQEVVIHGTGFRQSPLPQVYVDQYQLTPEWVDANTLKLPAGSLELLPLTPGAHNLRVVDGGMEATLPGAIVMGAPVAGAKLTLTPTSGPTTGGAYATIHANLQVILPGSKVIMRSLSGDEIRTQEITPGVYASNLEDNVKTLTDFQFRVPGVAQPGLYKIYLASGGQELYVGDFSYTMTPGRTLNLPNYPPMVIGGAARRGNTLFIGVKAGADPTDIDPFLMKSGLEIYDVSVDDNPVRLSQLRTDQPVTGVAVYGDSAYLAAGSDGLMVVDITDLQHPLPVENLPVPGNVATDVAVNQTHSVLAMSVANVLGTGYVRFFDLNSPQLDSPAGFDTIAFGRGHLQGQPGDVQLQGERFAGPAQRVDGADGSAPQAEVADGDRGGVAHGVAGHGGGQGEGDALVLAGEAYRHLGGAGEEGGELRGVHLLRLGGEGEIVAAVESAQLVARAGAHGDPGRIVRADGNQHALAGIGHDELRAVFQLLAGVVVHVQLHARPELELFEIDPEVVRLIVGDGLHRILSPPPAGGIIAWSDFSRRTPQRVL